MEKHSCTASELSCIIGSLFVELDPPCAACGRGEFIICGTTHSGRKAMITIADDGVFYFAGDTADLKAVLEGVCPEKCVCKRGEDYG